MSQPISNSSMGNIMAVLKRELMSYFFSPIAYVFIVIFLLLAGFFTFMIGGFFERGQASLESFFMWHPWLYLFFVPAVGMRLWSEEKRLGTMELLFTMPVQLWQVAVAKFLASWIFLIIALALTFPYVITVNWLGDPDNGVILCGYIGSFLLSGAYLAISCMTSALTRSQVISFILSVVICFLLVLCGWMPVTDMLISSGAPVWMVDMVAGLSFMTHYEGLQRGVVDSRDVIYFISVGVFALFTNAIILRDDRA